MKKFFRLEWCELQILVSGIKTIALQETMAHYITKQSHF